MEKVIADYVWGLIPGEPQVYMYKNFAAIPLFHPADGSPYYLTLREALERGALTITEVGHEGSVPELKVINKGDTAVLLLDGEELIGAKQNRVLNTTILLDAHTETVIPVSCTEHGRWAYRGQALLTIRTWSWPPMFKSVGLGWDYRFEAKNVVGSALECDSRVIHVASFPIEASEKIDPMASPGRRRAYRTKNKGRML